ncbi:uncharacterized protein [Primulina eburnea]|uniref:uncharacterized protein n=1 Tax=Primulina eburnea TaxID=1245227 RepID=UPI003C6C05FE
MISGGRPTTQRCLVKVSESKCLSFDYFGSCLGRFDMTDSSVHSITLRHDGAFGRPNQAFGKNGLNAKILLAGCSRLYHLELTGFFADAIFRSSRGPQIPQLILLKRLDLCWSYHGCNGGAILKLLHVMPSLESIKIDVQQGGRDDYDFDSVESVPPCIACHLNEVVFVGFEGRRQEVKLADFLLKNGVGLKKMLGLSRDKSSERRAQREFWDRLRGAYQMGDLELGPSDADEFGGLGVSSFTYCMQIVVVVMYAFALHC